MQNTWEAEIAELLNEIAAVQDDLFANLTKKRELLKKSDIEGLQNIAPEEDQLVSRLQICIDRRKALLDQAANEGLPSSSIKDLSQKIPLEENSDLSDRLSEASHRARLLQHQSLSNWLVVQRTLIHLSQLIEIIATGGRLQPTYGDGEPVNASGGLVDRAA
jgi:flagellar biosynthesis/type III secretory pathway chaperone